MELVAQRQPYQDVETVRKVMDEVSIPVAPKCSAPDVAPSAYKMGLSCEIRGISAHFFC